MVNNVLTFLGQSPEIAILVTYLSFIGMVFNLYTMSSTYAGRERLSVKMHAFATALVLMFVLTFLSAVYVLVCSRDSESIICAMVMFAMAFVLSAVGIVHKIHLVFKVFGLAVVNVISAALIVLYIAAVAPRIWESLSNL